MTQHDTLAAILAEREACAKLCDDISDQYAVAWDEDGSHEAKAASQAVQDAANAIRARSAA